MISTLEFNELAVILLDFVDQRDGFLYLRMVGAETAVGAIWAKLLSRESRGQKWSSGITIPVAGRAYPDYVAAQKQVTYRTLRTLLPGGMVDLALIHPILTVAEDRPAGFYLLTYEPELPVGFWARLNRSLAIPLHPNWAGWLWTQGQQPQTLSVLESRTVRVEGEYQDQAVLTESTVQPIQRLKSSGRVHCYRVRCQESYRTAWLQLIRQQLGLGIPLTRGSGATPRYFRGQWHLVSTDSGWVLTHADTVKAEAPTLNHLLTQARDNLGLHFIIKEELQ